MSPVCMRSAVDFPCRSHPLSRSVHSGRCDRLYGDHQPARVHLQRHGASLPRAMGRTEPGSTVRHAHYLLGVQVLPEHDEPRTVHLVLERFTSRDAVGCSTRPWRHPRIVSLMAGNVTTSPCDLSVSCGALGGRGFHRFLPTVHLRLSFSDLAAPGAFCGSVVGRIACSEADATSDGRLRGPRRARGTVDRAGAAPPATDTTEGLSGRAIRRSRDRATKFPKLISGPSHNKFLVLEANHRRPIARPAKGLRFSRFFNRRACGAALAFTTVGRSGVIGPSRVPHPRVEHQARSPSNALQ